MEEAEKLSGSRIRSAVAEQLSLAFLLLLGACVAAARQGTPGANGNGAGTTATLRAARQDSLHGVKNFGQVTPALYRGAQPTAQGFEQLQKLGVAVVIDFRDEKSQIDRERRELQARHMTFVSIPWNAFHDPAPEQVREYFAVLRANADKKVFVHCHKGADRTGTMVALYRIAAQGWTADDAVREMKTYHLHAFWFPHLERYVKSFPQQLKSDASLHNALAAAQPTAP